MRICVQDETNAETEPERQALKNTQDLTRQSRNRNVNHERLETHETRGFRVFCVFRGEMK
jgi:hypothetical protein